MVLGRLTVGALLAEEATETTDRQIVSATESDGSRSPAPPRAPPSPVRLIGGVCGAARSAAEGGEGHGALMAFIASIIILPRHDPVESCVDLCGRPVELVIASPEEIGGDRASEGFHRKGAFCFGDSSLRITKLFENSFREVLELGNLCALARLRNSGRR